MSNKHVKLIVGIASRIGATKDAAYAEYVERVEPEGPVERGVFDDIFTRSHSVESRRLQVLAGADVGVECPMAFRDNLDDHRDSIRTTGIWVDADPLVDIPAVLIYTFDKEDRVVLLAIGFNDMKTFLQESRRRIGSPDFVTASRTALDCCVGLFDHVQLDYYSALRDIVSFGNDSKTGLRRLEDLLAEVSDERFFSGELEWIEKCAEDLRDSIQPSETRMKSRMAYDLWLYECLADISFAYIPAILFAIAFDELVDASVLKLPRLIKAWRRGTESDSASERHKSVLRFLRETANHKAIDELKPPTLHNVTDYNLQLRARNLSQFKDGAEPATELTCATLTEAVWTMFARIPEFETIMQVPGVKALQVRLTESSPGALAIGLLDVVDGCLSEDYLRAFVAVRLTVSETCSDDPEHESIRQDRWDLLQGDQDPVDEEKVEAGDYCDEEGCTGTISVENTIQRPLPRYLLVESPVTSNVFHVLGDVYSLFLALESHGSSWTICDRIEHAQFCVFRHDDDTKTVSVRPITLSPSLLETPAASPIHKASTLVEHYAKLKMGENVEDWQRVFFKSLRDEDLEDTWQKTMIEENITRVLDPKRVQPANQLSLLQSRMDSWECDHDRTDPARFDAPVSPITGLFNVMNHVEMRKTGYYEHFVEDHTTWSAALITIFLASLNRHRSQVVPVPLFDDSGEHLVKIASDPSRIAPFIANVQAELDPMLDFGSKAVWLGVVLVQGSKGNKQAEPTWIVVRILGDIVQVIDYPKLTYPFSAVSVVLRTILNNNLRFHGHSGKEWLVEQLTILPKVRPEDSGLYAIYLIEYLLEEQNKEVRLEPPITVPQMKRLGVQAGAFLAREREYRNDLANHAMRGARGFIKF